MSHPLFVVVAVNFLPLRARSDERTFSPTGETPHGPRGPDPGGTRVLDGEMQLVHRPELSLKDTRSFRTQRACLT